MSTPGCGSTTDARKRLAEGAEQKLRADAEFGAAMARVAVMKVAAIEALGRDALFVDWLAAHDRALLDAVAERVLDAEPQGEFVYREGFSDGLDHAANIVRAAGRGAL